LGLALEQRLPHAMLGRAIVLPMLVDGEIGGDLGMLFAQGVEARHARNRDAAAAGVKPGPFVARASCVPHHCCRPSRGKRKPIAAHWRYGPATFEQSRPSCRTE